MKYFFATFSTSCFVALAVALAPFGLVYANSISLNVSSISPGTNVTVGDDVTFTISSSGFVEPSYSIADSFANTSVSNGDIGYDGDFSWTPTTSDIGSHELQISVKDLEGDSYASISENITVAAVGSVSIQSISPGPSVVAGAPMGFTVQANGFTNPIYNISDSFAGSSVNDNDISQNGYFDWTPTASDVGTHVITVRVNDYYGHIGSTQQQIVVSASGANENESGTATSAGQTPTTPVAATAFTSQLSVGSSGSQVIALQERLTTDGLYSGPITGYYGALTEAAVEKYQTNHTVSSVGIVGPMTRALLNEGL